MKQDKLSIFRAYQIIFLKNIEQIKCGLLLLINLLFNVYKIINSNKI